MIEDLPLDVIEAAFYDELAAIEMQKEANVGALWSAGKALAKPMMSGFGAHAGRMAKFWGTRAGIGAGVGVAGGAVTSKPGSRLRGAALGAGVGAAGGVLFGAGQAGHALGRFAQASRASAAGVKGAMQPGRAAYSTLRQAGFSREGLGAGRRAWGSGGVAQKAWADSLARQKANAAAVA